MAGLSHHRWLIDIEGSHITFLMKYHLVHADWRYSLPASFLRALPEDRRVQWLFWEGSFQCAERTIHGAEAQAAELARFVEAARPYAPALLRVADAADRAVSLARRALRKARRLAAARGR